MAPATGVTPDSGLLPTSIALATQVYKIAADGQVGLRVRDKDNHGNIVAIVVCVIVFLVCLPALVFLMCAYFEKAKLMREAELDSASQSSPLPTLEPTLASLYVPQPPPSRGHTFGTNEGNRNLRNYPNAGRSHRRALAPLPIVETGTDSIPTSINANIHENYTVPTDLVNEKSIMEHDDPEKMSDGRSQSPLAGQTMAPPPMAVTSMPLTTFMIDGQSELAYNPTETSPGANSDESVSDGTQPESAVYPPSYHTNDVSDGDSQNDRTP